MTPERVREAEQASSAFHVALTSIGVQTIEEALELWEGVSPSRAAATSGGWLRRAIRLVMIRRGRSRDLSLAYYRLARALRTGTTIADPRKPEPQYVSLDKLRHEFAALAASQSPAKNRAGSGVNEAPVDPVEESRQAPVDSGEVSADDEADRILVEEIEALEAEAERLEREAQREAALVLAELGPRNLNSKLKIIDTSEPADDVDALRDEAHRKAGSRQAAAAERVVMDGARGTLFSLAEADVRALGYIRLSRTGTPCGWCAMLISRGPVYQSKLSAERTKVALAYGDGDKYHDNCHCYAEPIFGLDQYNNSSQYDLNRQYAEEWPRITRGYSGDAALAIWRRHIRQQQKAIAQAATASLTTAQEA